MLKKFFLLCLEYSFVVILTNKLTSRNFQGRVIIVIIIILDYVHINDQANLYLPLRNYDTLSCDVKDGGSLLSDVFLSYFYLYCCILVILGFCMQQNVLSSNARPMTNAWPVCVMQINSLFVRYHTNQICMATYTVREKWYKSFHKKASMYF